MRSVPWRIGRALLIAAIAGLVVWGVFQIPWNTPERHYDISHADVEIELQRDGSLRVTEHLTFDFSGSFSGAFRNFPLVGDDRVTAVSVSEGGKRYRPGGSTVHGSYDTPGTFGVVREVGRDFEVVWHYQAADEERTFDISYTVVNAATVSDDVVDVGWSAWGEQWDFRLDRLDASISAASGARPEDAWLRPASLGDEPVLGEEATISIDDVPAHEEVALRAVFPREAIGSTGGAAPGGADLAEIAAAEAKRAGDEPLADRLAKFVVANELAISIGLGAIALLITALLILAARERRAEAPEYTPEPPEDIPPALAFALAREGAYDDRVVLATLLDLVDRGFYDARAEAGAKDLDLEIELADDRPERGGALEKYEIAVLDFFDKLLLPKGSWVALGKLADRIPKHSSSWKSRWDNMNEKLDVAGDAHMSWDRDLRRWRLLTAVAFVAAIAVVAYLDLLRTGEAVKPVIAGITTLLLMYALPGTWFRRLHVGPRERNAQWQAFERWTRDFPRLDDDPPSTLKIWRRILVYAVAFGTAERIAKSGRIPAPVGEEAASTGGWTGYAVGSSDFGQGFGGFSSGFASQVAPQSSSSGSGGSSGGGGGGGFSGGGGGGAW